MVGLPDSDHEGHSGWQIGQIDSIIPSVFAATPDPDVILLLIGTNDYGVNNDTGNATNRLEALIAQMAIARPFAKIVVANLTPRGEPENTQIQNTFNPFVPEVVERQRAEGREVYFTDLYSAVPLSDMPDSLHPNLAGYTKMATNWFNSITQLFGPSGSTNAPGISRTVVRDTLSEVVVTFSKPVADDAATLTNFSFSGGIAVLGASLDPVSLRDVVLTTGPMAEGTSYTLTVNGVRDRTTAQRPIAAGTTFEVFAYGTAGRGVFNNVAEADDYTLVYLLDIPNAPNYQDSITYDLDLSSFAPPFNRVAYYLELQPVNGPADFVWVSMDAFTSNPGRLGVPTARSGAVFQQPVTNMHVLSSVVTAGTNLSSGNMEFWPSNYEPYNAANVPNADSATFDLGDNPTPGNYGSMQLHNHDVGQVLFAFNRWGGFGGVADLGIGNRPGSNDLDWTFAQNAAGYAVKQLQVFVRPIENTVPPVLVGAVREAEPTRVTLTFSKALDQTATNISYYVLDGGLTVQLARLEPLNKLSVTLTTSPQALDTVYTVTVNGVQDRTPAHLAVAPDSTATFGGTTGGKVSLRDIIPGSETVTLITNGDFEDLSSGNSFAPSRWAERYGNAFYTMDSAPAISGLGWDTGAGAGRTHVDGGAGNGYGHFISRLAANTDYVVSAYMAVMGDGTHSGNAKLDMDDVANEVELTIDTSDPDAAGGYFVYATFNTADTGSNFKLRIFQDSISGTTGWPFQPVGAIWDNIAITKADTFIAPSPVPGIPAPTLLSPELAGSDIRLSWTALSNTTYRLESNPDLTPSLWDAVPGDVTGLSNTASKLDALSPSNRFYRVRALP